MSETPPNEPFQYTLDPIRGELSEAQRLGNIGQRAHNRFLGREKEPFNADVEVRDYVASWDADTRERIVNLHDLIAEQPRTPSATAHVIMPVAAGQEIGTLEQALSQYVDQDADPNSWEIFLFVNEVANEEGEQVKQRVPETLAVIDSFRESNPHLNIRVAHVVYPEAPTIGEIRADAWDVLLYDLVQSGQSIPDHVIGISHDAKTQDLPNNYVSTMQARALASPLADLLTCHYRYHAEGDPTWDSNKILLYWQYLRDERQKIIGRFPVPDANTSVRLGSYAAIGGFERRARIREMINLQQRLVSARREPEDNTPFIQYIEGIHLGINSRRAYRAINNGISPHHSWDLFPFLTGSDPVRASHIRPLERLDPLVMRSIAEAMELVYLSPLDLKVADHLRNEGRQLFGLAL